MTNQRKCKHLWEHKIVRAESLKEDAGEFDWLAHICKKCKLEVSGNRIDYEENKKEFKE